MSEYTERSMTSAMERFFERLDARFEINKAERDMIGPKRTSEDPMVDAIADARFAAFVCGDLDNFP